MDTGRRRLGTLIAEEGNRVFVKATTRLEGSGRSAMSHESSATSAGSTIDASSSPFTAPDHREDGLPSDTVGDTAETTRVFRSQDLLGGARECRIEHGDQVYRLRLTMTGKLYLVK